MMMGNNNTSKPKAPTAKQTKNNQTKPQARKPIPHQVDEFPLYGGETGEKMKTKTQSKGLTSLRKVCKNICVRMKCLRSQSKGGFEKAAKA